MEPEDAVIEKIHQACATIDGAADAEKTEASKSYEVLLGLVDSDNHKAKRLVAAAIPRYFHLFPALHETAINKQFDLCEDEDNMIRLTAIRGLGEICKRSPTHVSRIADVLGQLLLADTELELQMVKRTFLPLFSQHPQVSFSSLLTHIREGGDSDLREQCLIFFKEQALRLKPVLKDEVAKILLDGVKQLLEHEQGPSADEFDYFMGLLLELKAFDTDTALASDLTAVILKNLPEEFDGSKEEQPRAFLTCLNKAKPLIELGADNTAFLAYFFDKVAPNFSSIDEKNRLTMLQGVADTCMHASPTAAKHASDALFILLREHVPAETTAEGDEAVEPPKINFSFVESLLFILIQLASKDEGYVDALAKGGPNAKEEEREKDKGEEDKENVVGEVDESFRSRLPFLQEATRGYHTKVRDVSARMRRAKADSVEGKQKLEEQKKSVDVALRTTTNILALVKKLVSEPPRFTDTSLPSWRTVPKGGRKGRARGKGGQWRERNQRAVASKGEKAKAAVTGGVIRKAVSTPKPKAGGRAPKRPFGHYIPPGQRRTGTDGALLPVGAAARASNIAKGVKGRGKVSYTGRRK